MLGRLAGSSDSLIFRPPALSEMGRIERFLNAWQPPAKRPGLSGCLIDADTERISWSVGESPVASQMRTPWCQPKRCGWLGFIARRSHRLQARGAAGNDLAVRTVCSRDSWCLGYRARRGRLGRKLTVCGAAAQVPLDLCTSTLTERSCNAVRRRIKQDG
ncbi:MAG: hypothetical protein RLZZ214_2282 [Verrucomicrobiota bacterium]|jgi:hypothetical protein